jgi:hypothetical protein
MSEDKLFQLLKQADTETEVLPLDTASLSLAVHERLRRRKQTLRYGMAAAAAMIIVACVFGQRQYQFYQKQQQITRLQQDIEDLNRRTEQTLALVRDILARQQQQDELRKLNQPLAGYKNSIRREIDETAFILVYQADRMVEKYNNAETAIDFYNQVIERFGDTPSAQTARERLDKIKQKNQSNKI